MCGNVILTKGVKINNKEEEIIMKRIITLTLCMLMMFSMTIFADSSNGNGKIDDLVVTPMFEPCPLPSHNWIYESTDREQYVTEHGLYEYVEDDYGNVYKVRVGTCYDTKERSTAYYSCSACPKTKTTTSTRTLSHDPYLD
jgi:hypothetical protein